MPDTEKVIKGLGSCVEYFASKVKGVMFNEWLEESRKAIALLKAREPRVMTLEEVEKSYSKTPIWFEESRLQTVYPAIYHKTEGPEGFEFADITDFYYQRQNWAYGTYGKTWRCWTSRPTDEQREKEPWNGVAKETGGRDSG